MEERGLHREARLPTLPELLEGFPAVACSDSNNPDSYTAWSAAGAASDELFGYFGRIWAWASSICADWPAADTDRYLGPFNRPTGNPVLVVGNLFDPATRYEGAETAHNLLPNSSLLTVHGWGHTSLFLSACADQAIASYLLAVAPPPPGTVCEQDVVPFAQPLQASLASSRNASCAPGVLPADDGHEAQAAPAHHPLLGSAGPGESVEVEPGPDGTFRDTRGLA